MEVKLRPFLRATLWYLEWIDLFQALPALPNDERNLFIRWLKGHIDTRANSMFVTEDGSPFHIHTNGLFASSVSLILYVGRFHSLYRPRGLLG